MKPPARILLFKCLTLASIGLFLMLFYSTTADAQTEYGVTARIRTAVCGDNHADGNEECDRNDLKHAECEDLGYAGGDLSCTSACEYDTTECISPTPTLTPTPTPISNSTSSSSTNTSSTTQSTGNSDTKDKEKEDKEKDNRGLLDLLDSKIPKKLNPFDPDNNQKIDTKEIQESVGNWVGNWKISQKQIVFDENLNKPIVPGSPSCDVNGDGICNLVDFSILLYYIGR